MVTLKQLQDLANLRPVMEQPSSLGKMHGHVFDLSRFMAENNISGKPSSDSGGVKYRLDVCVFDSSHTDGEAAIFQGPDGKLGYKCFHNSCSRYHWADVREKFEPGYRDRVVVPMPAHPSNRNPSEAAIENRAVRFVAASSILPREMEYTFFPYIPRGEVTWIEGTTKSGKTMCAIDLIARGSRGEKHPLTGELIAARKSAILTCEDSPDHTLVPRLIAAKANLDNVKIIRVEDEVSGQGLPPSLQRDMAGIARGLRADGVELLLIDGSFGMLGVKDGNDYAESYRVMMPVVGMVRDLNIGCEALRHTKKADSHALHRGIGSVGYGAQGRSTITVALDRDDPTNQRRFWAHAGANGGAAGATLAFQIDGVMIDGFERSTGVAHWLEVVEEVTADDLDRVRSPEDRSKAEAAADWLREALAEGPRPATEILAEGRKAGHAQRTLYRARSVAGIGHNHMGFPMTAHWFAKNASIATDSHMANPGKPGGFGTPGPPVPLGEANDEPPKTTEPVLPLSRAECSGCGGRAELSEAGLCERCARPKREVPSRAEVALADDDLGDPAALWGAP